MIALKTILYMGVMHGFFTFYVPFQLAARDVRLFNLGILRYVAVALWMSGAWIIILCSIDMVRRGLGTPAHIDPPKRLLITGMYRYVRNPIYFGALLALMGHIAWTGSGLVISYFVCYVVSFHILILFFEEPVLRRIFGKEYEEYLTQVPRWIPKI